MLGVDDVVEFRDGDGIDRVGTIAAVSRNGIARLEWAGGHDFVALTRLRLAPAVAL